MTSYALTHLSKHKKMLGFTLIEIMIVIFIMGIIVSLIVIKPSVSKQQNTAQIIKQFQHIFLLTKQEAVFTGKLLSLTIQDKHFVIYEYQVCHKERDRKKKRDN